MPEGDTVWRTAQHLDQALTGQVLTAHRLPGARRSPPLDLSGAAGRRHGRAAASTCSPGSATDHTLHTHLKMEGSWHLYRPTTPWRRPAHEARVVLRTDEWPAVGFALGIIEVVAPRRRGRRVVGHLGPDLLGPDWDEDEALRRLQRRPGPADRRGAARPAQPGRHRQHVQGRAVLPRPASTPTAPVGDVPDLPRLVRRAKQVLEANKERVEQATTGDLRRGRHDLGLPARRAAVPALRHAGSASPCRATSWRSGRRTGARLPARPGLAPAGRSTMDPGEVGARGVRRRRRPTSPDRDPPADVTVSSWWCSA